jgi:hypothetical protein
MNLLSLEREAVYRRLRKDVFFTASEMIKIASVFEISLDEIANINSEQYAFQMRPVNYLEPSEGEAQFLRKVIDSIHQLKDYPDSEFFDICNKLPRHLVSGFPLLNKFYLFKWKYNYSDEKEIIPLSEISISEEKRQIDEAFYKAMKQVSTTSFIFDNRIFEYLIKDINYFFSIYLISEEEKALIKEELNALLDYLQEVANSGCYPETRNKVNLYISQLNINTNYSYSIRPDANICFISVFEKFEIFSINTKMVNKFLVWMKLKKRTSIQISEVDERSRIDFFNMQRKLVQSL